MEKSGSCVISLVDSVIQDAVEHRASDIHAEPTETGLRIRFRIDGILHDRLIIPPEIMAQVTSRIKVLAHIDIAQMRIPQDGKFSQKVCERQIDFRVSTFPTLYGEKVVIRILDRARTMIELEALGFSEGMLAECKRLLHQASGFFLVTGPTGSGKTTTLYAALSHLNNSEKHIITLEDPVEYHVTSITQGHIHPAAGFSFAKGLRALLRQDPDIVMVGEIRDPETASIALEAALTGHMVLSTVHTTDAPSVIIRLMDMGIEPFLINAAVTGVLAQRLARKLCSSCKYQRDVSPDEAAFCTKFGIDLSQVYEAKGCDMCHNFGYSGRIGIFELLVMTTTLRDLVASQPSLDSFYAQARSEGMMTLWADGIKKVREGIISLQELIKAIS